MKRPSRRRGGDIFRDEHGFTTTSMVISLLITLSLLFTAAQVYRLNSASAEVQDVADAAALSAENQVAEFMVVARFCDAIVLSLSLTGITVTGLGIAALCTPATATVSGKLLDAGRAVLKARDSFSEKATGALNKLQEALPYFAAACSAAVAHANDADSAGSAYLGAGILVPARGELLEASEDEAAEDVAEKAEEEAGEIRDDAKDAEDAAEKANRCKERAFEHDCGADPGYCMYERAVRLAGVPASDNPLFESVDAWSFSVALERARAYYRARVAGEVPADGSPAERSRSALRARFYRYAVEKMKDGYVHDEAGSFAAYFPRLPKNTSEMRSTSLYTENAYLVTELVESPEPALDDAAGSEAPAAADPVVRMHAYAGCPGAVGTHRGYSSIAHMESAGLQTCPECKFTAASLGKVAAASSSIENGFEYHYNIVADEAQAYAEARREADERAEDVKGKVGDLLEELAEALRDSAGKRIEPSPPGRYGVIAFVVNAGSFSPAGSFAGSFVSSSGSLGPRAAISAATLLDEGSAEGKTVVNSLLDGLREGGGALVGAAGMVLDAWSWLLMAYADGQDAVAGAVEGGLNALPLVGASGLGTWAAGKLRDAVGTVGLQPAEIGALKPALVNSAHVASKGEGRLAASLISVKQRVVTHPQAATDVFSAVLTDAERAALAQVEEMGDSVEIASIELLGEDGPAIPVTIPIPAAAREQGVAAIQSVFARLRSQHAQTMDVKPWE